VGVADKIVLQASIGRRSQKHRSVYSSNRSARPSWIVLTGVTLESMLQLIWRGPCDLTRFENTMAFDAFISYSSQDKTAADATCAVLEGDGIRCWIAPRDIRPGVEYGAAIVDAIDQCHVMVLVFSSSANESRQIHREIERAVAKGVPILPVRIEEVAPTKSMEYFLGAIHWLDALSPPLEKHLHKLAETVQAMLKIDAGDGAPNAFVAKASKETEPSTQRAGNVKQTSGAAFALVRHARRTNWLLPAICGTALVVLIGGAGWLYHVGAFVPGRAHSPTPTQPIQAAPTMLRTEINSVESCGLIGPDGNGLDFSGVFAGGVVDAGQSGADVQLKLVRDQNSVRGSYFRAATCGTISGNVTGNRMVFNWNWKDSFGRGIATQAGDILSGTFGFRDATEGGGTLNLVLKRPR
jgi:hypothetical protein